MIFSSRYHGDCLSLGMIYSLIEEDPPAIMSHFVYTKLFQHLCMPGHGVKTEVLYPRSTRYVLVLFFSHRYDRSLMEVDPSESVATLINQTTRQATQYPPKSGLEPGQPAESMRHPTNQVP